MPDSLEGIRTFCLSEFVVDGEKLDSAEDGAGEQMEQNLHAKLYVYQDDAGRNQWFIGSPMQPKQRSNAMLSLSWNSEEPAQPLN